MGRPKKWERCEQSGKSQMLSWQPDPKADYPGAVVCIGCSFGVMIRKGSDYPATSKTGFEGTAGVVRAHDVKRATPTVDSIMRYV